MGLAGVLGLAFNCDRANHPNSSLLQGFNKSTKKLEVVTTANQDPLLTHVPIIGIDIWV